ncbi:hypothetical protein CERSUDRAFT_113665 [Gelatoporia subvermispora B]|uniref:Nucleolar protein 16 n=1 Tax=Ceriporiopsis subvermispora (strain B) TaxID=914234 RepID=M2PPQ8_CERS8|nr:hypothetical protein CERSUDRAFT_113665 [Gelatoporia subvermispora B]
MANPRQRRKLRSGSHKPVHHSRRAQKILKKQPPIRGPKVLQEAWDSHKTVRQNYEALGLVASLNPTASGGVERPLDRQGLTAGGSSATPEASSSSPSSGSGAIPKGYGRIIRDEDGNIIDVEMGEEEPEAAPEEEEIEAIPNPADDDQQAGWVGLGTHPRTRQIDNSGSRVVQVLEHLSESQTGRKRYASAGEVATLGRLVQKYKEDVEAMARDRKLNPNQRTAGELSRAIKKAGGFAELMKRS